MSTIKALTEVAKELKAVKMANMQRYKARHIYDVYNMIQPLLAKHGIVVGRELIKEESKEVESAKGSKGVHRYQLWAFRFKAANSEDFFETQFPAESIDWGDKAASQCDAMAFKQMFIHTFQIPTQDMQEPDDQPQKNVARSKEKVFNPPPKPKTKRTKKEIETLREIMDSKELDRDTVNSFSVKMIGQDVNELEAKDFDTLVKLLKDSTKAAIKKQAVSM